MDFQEIISKFNRYWAKQGCCALPPGGPAAPGELLREPGPAALAGAVGPAAGGLFGGRYLYQVLFKPPPRDIRRLFLDSFRAAGIDRSEHDVRWEDFDGGPADAAPRGWTVLLDGLELARFTYLFSAGAAGPRAAELLFGLERLALASQRRRDTSALEWAGRLTYGELHRALGKEAP